MWSGSHNAGVFVKITEMAGRCLGGSQQNAPRLNAGGGSGELVGIYWDGKGGCRVKVVPLYVKI